MPFSFVFRPTSILAFGVLCASLSGCRVGPDYEQPELALPDAWHNAATKGLDDGEADLQTWWRNFKDPVLDELIQRASQGNLDLEIAASRIYQSRANLGITETELWPTVNATASAGVQQFSREILGPFGGSSNEIYEVGADLTWELDLWGRIRRTIDSAEAVVASQIEDYRDLLVVLYAEIGTNYVEVRTLQLRIQYAQANVEAQSGSVKLTQDLVDAEIRPELDVQQAKLNLARTEASIPFLRQQLYVTLHRMAVLVGEHPDALYSLLEQAAKLPPLPADLHAGIPTDLIRRRPDIRSAERQLAAQTEQIGAAEALLYPTFALSGNIALQAASLGNLGSSDALSYSLGLPVQFNLFDRKRLRNNIRVQEELTAQLLSNYELTVLTALAEVETSIVSVAQERERIGYLQESVDAATRSVELVTTLYRNDLTNFQNVLEMQSSLAQQQDQLASSQGQIVQDVITFYKALGGGWGSSADAGPDAADAEEPVASEDATEPTNTEQPEAASGD